MMNQKKMRREMKAVIVVLVVLLLSNGVALSSYASEVEDVETVEFIEEVEELEISEDEDYTGTTEEAGMLPGMDSATVENIDELLEEEAEVVEEAEDDVVVVEETMVTIEEEAVPLAASLESETWALMNLILAVVIVAMSMFLLMGHYVNKKASALEETDTMMEKLRRNNGLIRLMSIVPSVLAIVVFIQTENMLNPMGVVDKWTVLMLIIAGVQVIVTIEANKVSVEDEVENVVAL